MIVDSALYENGRRHADLPLEDTFEACRGPEAFAWIGLHEPTRAEFEAVRREFDLHELAVEDAIHAHQRPKLEVYGDSLFIVLRPARYDQENEAIELGEIALFVGESFLISVRYGDTTGLHDVRLEIERDPELLRRGPGAVLHAIVDRVVDDYLPVLHELDEDITGVEGEVFSEASVNPARRIYELKREVLAFQRATAPLVEPLDRLARGQVPFIHDDMRSYFRDVHDHILRIVPQIEGMSDLLTSVLEANISQINVQQSNDMRKISAWVAIAAVPTAISAIYGMNFEHMPELETVWGYPAILALMGLICGFLYFRFKRSGWL